MSSLRLLLPELSVVHKEGLSSLDKVFVFIFHESALLQVSEKLLDPFKLQVTCQEGGHIQ